MDLGKCSDLLKLNKDGAFLESLIIPAASELHSNSCKNQKSTLELWMSRVKELKKNKIDLLPA